MHKKNMYKAIVAIAIAMAFVMPGAAAFANVGTVGVTTNLENTDTINIVEDGKCPIDKREVTSDTSDIVEDAVLGSGGNIIYVGSGLGNDSATIQGGINLAGTGDTVYVHNGVYYEHVTVNKQLNLVGQSRENVIVDGSGTGIVFYVTASGISMNKFTVTNGEYGIYLDYSPGSKLRNNTIYNNSNNFYVQGWFIEDFIYDIDPSNTINGRPIYYLVRQSDIELNETHNFGYLGLIACNNIIAKNSDVSGVMLVNTIKSTISNVSCHNSIHGIYLYGKSKNNKIENCFSYNNSCGIYFDMESSNNDIINCTTYNNSGCGIFPNRDCSNSNIINCTSYNNNQYGIFLGSHSGSIINCTTYNNNYGIYLYYAPRSKLRSNTIYNNVYNFGVRGKCISDFEYDIDPSNTINGRPIYYLVEQSDIELNETYNFGYLGLISCSNITAKNSDVGGMLLVNTIDSTISNVSSHNSGNGIYLESSSNNNITDCDSYNNSGTYGDGIYLHDSSNNNIINCDSYNNHRHGIYLESSSNNNIINCNSYNNYMYGILLLFSSNNNIINCNFYNNDYGIYFFCPSNCNIANCTIYNNSGDGIYLYYSVYSKFTNCTLYNNNYGIYLEYSFYNLIHHNNLVNNIENAYDDSTGMYKNQWDDGSEGNYWSDYTGEDIDGDGIGDTPYYITGGSNRDRYPLMMIMDSTPPIITDVTATPELQKPDEPVNITCTVIDVQVATVKVHIDGPEGFTLEEEINEGSSYYSYYYEDTYTILGDYYYYIWANDTSGNIAVSPTYTFVITEFDKPISIVGQLPTWTKTIPFTVAATAFDNTGVENVTLWSRYSSNETDWTNWTAYVTDEGEPWSWAFTSSEGDGYYEFYSIAVDDYSNVEEPPEVADASCGLDTVPPVTTIVPNGTMGGDGWYTSSVTVTLSATDELSGVESTWYLIDSGYWKLYNIPFTVSGDGQHTVYYYSFDNAGNREDTKSADIKIDTTPPVTEHEFEGIIGEDGWFVSDVTVTLSAEDEMPFVLRTINRGSSGVNYTMYKVDDDEWTTYVDPFVVAEDGDHTLYYYSVDLAGNIEPTNDAAFKIDHDVLPPETTHEFDGIMGDNDWYKSNVAVTLTAEDDSVGVDYTMYKLDDDVDWRRYTGLFLVPEDDVHTLQYFSVDYVGNEEDPCDPVEFKIDQTNPTINLTWDGENSKLVADVDDETSGVAKVEFYVSGEYVGEATEYPYEWIVPNPKKGDKGQAIVYDNAGNKAVSAEIDAVSQSQSQSSSSSPVPWPFRSLGYSASGKTGTLEMNQKPKLCGCNTPHLYFFDKVGENI